ncbi:MAG: beta strand repeat-containing protein [Candidatus Saccharimonadales bacterium]
MQAESKLVKSLYCVLRSFRVFLALAVLFSTVTSAVYTYTRTLTPTHVYAATSSNLNYQARLLNSSGSIVPDGYYNIDFKLYTAASGGASVWGETYFDSNGPTAGNDNRVRVVNGYLSVNLASLTAFPTTINWDQDMWLTMNIGGSSQTATPTYDGEMTPRVKLTAVPYAFQAKQAEKLVQKQATFTGTVDFGTLTADRTYLFPDTSLATTASPGTICVFNGANSNCPAASGSAFYIQNDTVLQTQSNFNIQARDSTTTGTIGGIIRGAAGGQTVDLLQLQGSDGSVLARFSATGSLTAVNGTFTGTINTTTGTLQTNSVTRVDNAGNLVNIGNITGTGALAVQATAGTLALSATGANVITASTNGVQRLQVDSTGLTLAASQALTVTGGITSTRPASPTEGMIYYDTTTKQLLVYANAKWQADRTTATKIVGMGAPTGCTGAVPVASQNFDAADFVVNSCTSAQSTINAAITALPAGGGTVYIMEGTYIIDGAILLPANVTITGSGSATVIKLKTGINAAINGIQESGTSSRSVISNIKLDGNKAGNTAGVQTGININGGNPGTRVDNVWVEQFRSNGIEFSAVKNASITNSTIVGTGTTTGDRALYLSVGSNQISVSDNAIQGNTGNGIHVNTGSPNNVFSGNTSQGNGGGGIVIVDSSQSVVGNIVAGNTGEGISISIGSNNTVSGNTISGNSLANNSADGIRLSNATNNIISGNRIINSGGTSGTSTSNGINVTSTSTNNNVTGNIITDTFGTGFAINVSSASSTANYLADNTYSGTGASSISDTGTGTIYAGQLNSTNSLVLQGPGAVNVGSSGTGTGSLSVTGGYFGSQLATPATPTVAAQGTTGTSTYQYRITALDGTGETAPSTQSTGVTNGNATLSGINFNRITWNRQGGATSYKIYRTNVVTGSPSTLGLVGTVNASATTMQFDDTGLAATTAAPNINTTGGGTFSGNVLIKPGADNTSVFQIQNSAGSNIFNVDTNNNQVQLGKTGPSGIDGSLLFYNASNAFTGTIKAGVLTGNVTYLLPVVTAGTYNICTDSGNCAGVGASLQTSYNNSIGGSTAEIKLDATRSSLDIQDADVTLGGTTNLLAVRGSTGSGLGSLLFGVQANGNFTASGTATVQGSGGVVLGTQTGNVGKITLYNSGNNNPLILQSGTTGGSGLTLTLPNADGGVSDCLKTNGSGVLAFSSCTGGAGGSVASLNSLTGALTLVGTLNQINVANGGSTITLSTPQDISTVSAPTFAGITVGKAPPTMATVSDNPLSNVATTVNVSSTTGYPSGSPTAPATILIDSEIMTYTGTTATSFTGVVRGVYGTAAASHSSGAVVQNYLLSAVTSSTAAPKFVVQGNGNVGIGDATPTALFTVGANDAFQVNNSGNVTAQSSITLAGASGTISTSATNAALTLQSNGTGSISLDSGTTGSVNIGTGANAKTIQIGTTTGAVSQSINIGNNATAGSSSSIVIGSTVGTSPMTLQSGTSGILIKGADSATALQIQKSDTSVLLVADTTNMIVKVGTTGSATLGAGARLFTTVAEVSTTLRIGDGTNGVSYNDTVTGVAGKLRFYGTARNSIAQTLTPEFAGATLTGDGTNNSGAVTSDFCSKSNTPMPDINTGVCVTAADKHNFYSWTANATNDYDVWTNWQVPSNFGGWDNTPIQFYGWRTSATESVTLTLYRASGAVCGTATTIGGTVSTWNLTNYTSPCTPTAGENMYFRVQLSVGTNNNFARMGEIIVNYKGSY